MFGDELVEVLEELGQAAFGVNENRVMVVGVDDKRNDLHTGSFSSDGQAIDEGVVGLAIGSQQKLPLGTTTCDQVAAARNDLTRRRHILVSLRPVTGCVKNQPGR